MVPLQYTFKHIKTIELSNCFIFRCFAVCSREGITLGTVRLLYKPNLSRAALFFFKELTWLSSVLVTALLRILTDIHFVSGFLNVARIRGKNWNKI